MAQQKQFISYVINRVIIQGLLVLAIVVFGFFAVDNYVWRWDLTQDERFSISEASHELAGSLEDPLTIRAYFSDNIPERVRPFQRQVFDILSEYEAHGNGKIKVERYDPLESATAASEASNYGVRPIQLRVYEATEASSLQVFGSLVLIYGDKSPQVIDIATRYPQGYEGLSVLEYEISSKIWEVTHEKPKLGLTGHLERPGGGRPGMPPQFGGGQARPEFNGLRQLLGEAFEVTPVNLKEEEPDPKAVPLLVIVRPKDFSDVEVFRLDQYVMKGGRVLLFITQGIIDETPWGRRQFTVTGFKTGLDAWLEHHGVRVPNEFVCQLQNAIPITVESVEETPFGKMRVGRQQTNWFWPVFGAEGAINQDNPAVQTLKAIALWWPHPVDVLDNKLGDKEATVLVSSHSAESWRWKDMTRVDRRFLTREADGPRSSDLQSSAVAVALEGTFNSFFADKPVPPSLRKAPDEEGDEKEEKEGEEKPPAGPDVVAKSTVSTQVVVIGNAFFLSDALLQRADDQARQAGLLAFNLVDWLARSRALIALRAKRYSDRQIVDEGFNDELESLAKKATDGEISEDEYREGMELAKERQKASWKRSRWFNILMPCFLVLFAGAVVWIIRAAGRGAEAHVPAAVPPRGLDMEKEG